MKRIVAVVLTLALALSIAPAAFAASSPSDIGGHTYEAQIKQIDSYNGLTPLVANGKFNPDQIITQKEFCAVVNAIYPGRTLGISGNDTPAQMDWACNTVLVQAGKAMGYTTSWAQVTTEQLTRARACVMLVLWINSDAGLKNSAGTQGYPTNPTPTTTTTGGFYGPDGAWYENSTGYATVQNSDGFWHGNTGLWFKYRIGTNVNSNSQYGYWNGGKWYSYTTTNNSGNDKNNPFVDVLPGSYYYDAVLWMYHNDYTSGTSATTFSPEATCSKAQVITFIWRAAGRPSSRTSCPISGVDQGSYYYKALCWAAEKSMITGSDDGTDPTQVSCTRAMIVYYLWRAFGSPSGSYESYVNKFTDVPSGASYRTAVGWAAKNNITSGTSSSTFSPYDVVTRGQIATFIYRTYASR